MSEENIQGTQAANPIVSLIASVIQEIKAGRTGNRAATERTNNKPRGIPEEIIGVRNQTNRRLTLKFEVDQDKLEEIEFAPLQKRSLSASRERTKVYKELDKRGVILLEHKDQPEQLSGGNIFEILSNLAIPYFVLGSLVTNLLPAYKLYYWIGMPFLLLLFAVFPSISSLLSRTIGWTTVFREAVQSLTLLLVVFVGLGLTVTTIYFFGDGPIIVQSGPSLIMLTRLLQIHFIAIASLLPALLYYLFDRHQLASLRERFEQQIFNLDPTIENLGDVQAKYGSQLDELYGRNAIVRRGRLVPGTRWPILLCTLVITFGWIMTLQPIGTGITIKTPSEMIALFSPQPALLTLGFLGAYYFALNMILRRYTRGDLQPKAYSHIAVRVLIVAISAWVIEMIIGTNTYTRVLVFIVGIIPETLITALQEIFRSNRVIAWALPQWQEKHPLTGLEGIDLYDRSRLAEEGITNVESLAHHDLIDLILATRIPVSRLVDWVDQAILYLHLPEEDEIEENNGQTPKLLHQLKECGVRNATDLGRLLDPFKRNEPRTEALIKHLKDRVIRRDKDGKRIPARIELIYATMKDDDWLGYIRHWRAPKCIQETTITIAADGRIRSAPNG